MISNPRHGWPPRLMAHQPTRCSTTLESSTRVHRPDPVLHAPGIEIVGPLPPEIQAVTVFSAGVSNTSSQREEARALIAYLTSPEADAAKRQHGMEPA